MSTLLLAAAAPTGADTGPREDQWWFSAWQIEQEVWPITQGAGVTVAVIDGGVNGTLPDLRDAMVPGTDSESGKGDGHIAASADLQESHGTSMAALIASRGTATGYVGVAPEAKVMSIKSNFTVWDKSIRYAVDHGAKVINVSQGFAGRDGCRPETQQAVHYALQRDVVIVASAGNDGDQSNMPEEPANCPGVLAVGAVDNEKRPWDRTQRQPYVAVAAPGFPVNVLLANGQVTNHVAGTSQAAALTSAVVALVRSEHPEMPAREVVQRIINTTKDAGPPGNDHMTGAGVVIPAAALTADVPADAPNPVFAAYDRWLAEHQQASTTPSSTPAPKSEATTRAEQADRNLVILLVAAGGGTVIGGVVLLRARSRRTAPAGPNTVPRGGPPGPPPGWGGQTAPPQGGYPQGPPQNWQPAPPQTNQPGPPPGWSGQPGTPQGGQPGHPQQPYLPPQAPGGSHPPT